jgi:RNA polymerase sigma-70 factor (ECF subfamily)
VLGERFGPVLRRAQGGDADAFTELWRDAHPPLSRYLYVSVGADAEDVASQMWVRVVAALAQFRGDEPGFRRWLVTIARNVHIDEVRRATRRPEDLAADPSARAGAVVPHAQDAAEVADEHLSTERALRLVSTLPPDQAELVMLRVVIGLDVADVAAVVGRSPAAVRVAVHRALGRLRDELIVGDVTHRGDPSFRNRDG